MKTNSFFSSAIILMKRMKLFTAFIIALFSFVQNSCGQNGVLIAPIVGTPDGSSMLEVRSDSKGFLTPRMTENQRGQISNPAQGLLVYQTDGASGFWYYSSIGWVELSQSYGNYINNGTLSQNANFNITGYGFAGDSLRTPTLFINNYRHTADAGNYENVISANATECGFRMLTNDNKSLGFFYSNSNIGIGICNGYGDWALLAGGLPNTANTTLDLRTNNLQRLFIDGSGNVGIGTTTPSQKLEVNGNAKINGNAIVNGNIDLDDNLSIEGSSTYRVFRNLASYSIEAPTQGAFVINTNQPWNSGCMFRVKIEGYFYDASAPFETTIGAYMYVNDSMVNRGYVNTGAKNLQVRLAKNTGTNTVAIILGTEAGLYQYPKLTVTSFSQGFGGINPSYADGWSISQVTSLSGYSFIANVPDVSSTVNISGNFIQNQSGSSQNANFQISGTGTADQFIGTNGFISLGTNGLMFQPFGGGWGMWDSDWIRSYGNKKVYISNFLEVDNGIASGGLSTPGAGNIGFIGGRLVSGIPNFISNANSQDASVFSWRGTNGYNSSTYKDYMVINYSGSGSPGTAYGDVYAYSYHANSPLYYYDIINDLDAIDHMHPLAQKNTFTQNSELFTDPESMPSFLLSKSADGLGYYYDLNKNGAFAVGAVRQLRQETKTADQALEAKVERLEKIVEQLTGEKLGSIAFEQKVTAYKDVKAFAVIDARIAKSSVITINGISNYEIYDQKDGSFMIRFAVAPMRDTEFTYSASF